MDTIIKRAIEGGWIPNHFLGATRPERCRIEDGYLVGETQNIAGWQTKERIKLGFIVNDKSIVLDPRFWEALGKECGWSGGRVREAYTNFFEINLTEGWAKAEAYLSELIS